MTVEHGPAPELAKAEAASTAIEAYSPRHRNRQRRMAQSAFEGFRLLEAVESPWAEFRTQLEDRIIGQQAAIDAIVEALEGSDVRMPSDKRPIANFAFLGPTGVGKSETAKSLADLLELSRKFIKIDCSNFSHGHEVANLIGAPAGYVGYDQTPLLSSERVEGDGTVVLFDEVEKGSDALYNLMLQIMEDGELQMRDGSVTSFRGCVIIMTSNLGAREMADELSPTKLGFAARDRKVAVDQIEDVARKKFSEHFRAEFINRLTAMVVFHPLNRDSLDRVLDVKLNASNKEYEEELGARISVSQAVREYLIDIAAQEPDKGARPLVRALDSNIYAPFGRYWGAGSIPESTHVRVFHKHDFGQEASGDESPLVFAAKYDGSIHKKRLNDPSALVAAFSGTASTSTEIELRRRDDEEDCEEPEEPEE
ncbi:MAG TPA: AAA family ATPase [Candidatus Saccharimonadales bacterium]|nr:AAA family ATPase [Candidatus Saccharimonadales bacterium]